MKKLRIFEFTGFGNYSDTFGWDNGLNVYLGEETTFPNVMALEEQSIASGNGLGLPIQPEKGVYWNIHEHGGSRNVFGYVIANSISEAELQAKKIKNKIDKHSYETT